MKQLRWKLWLMLLTGACALAMNPGRVLAQYRETNLVSSTSAIPAEATDPGMIDPWGLAAFPNSPFWVSAQNSSTSRLYTGSGNIVPLVVDIPCVTDTAGDISTPCPLPGEGLQFLPGDGQFNFFGPTGVVANSFKAFSISSNGASGPALFIFDTLDGLIVGWNPNVNPTEGIVAANRFAAGAGYSGLDIAGPPWNPHLYAADGVPGGGIDVFDAKFNYVGTFAADANLPTPSNTVLFVPYGLAVIGNKLYVTYFNLNGSGGILDVCNLATSLTAPKCRRLYASNLSGTETSPVLASPWGIVRAPHDFWPLSNKILVGNVDDGKIHAFNPDTGHLVGTLKLADGTPFAMPGLWGLQFGSGDSVQGPKNYLFFNAGVTPDPKNPALFYGGGVFGVIKPAL